MLSYDLNSLWCHEFISRPLNPLAIVPMDQLLSPKQVAAAIGASESSLKRWCDQGLLSTVKTAGGHRRIPVQEVLRFVRERNHTVVEPMLLALPDTSDRKSRRIEAGADRLVAELLADNEGGCRAIVMDHFVSGEPVSRLFDEVFAVAFHKIGEMWQCHSAEIYQERCSCQIALRLLHELRAKLPPTDPDCVALGATAPGDIYSLPVTMSEIVLRSVGWDARLLGSSILFDSMCQAVEVRKPGIFWLSSSYIPDEAEFVQGFNELAKQCENSDTVLVVGGRALTAEVRKQLQYSAFCDTMSHLADFAKTMQRQRRSKANKRKK